MSLMDRGFKNKILRVNLTTGKISAEQLKKNVMRLLLGGKGLGAWYMYNEIKSHTDPLSPDNLLIFVTGPLTGTTAPTAGRFGVMTKSPATKTILDSYCGGFFGQTMKFAGYDGIIISGAAKEAKVLIIDDDQVAIKSGKEVWGKTTIDTANFLKSKYGKNFQTIVIGPPGERKANIAGIFNDERTAGRGGAGAVMGAKMLKAILLRGTGEVKLYNPNEFEEAVWIAERMLRMSSQVKRLAVDGTANILELVNSAGALPTRNFQSGQFEKSKEITGETWRKEYWERDIACHGCPIGCSKVARMKTTGLAIDGPDYETIYALGSNCGIADKEAIVHANYLCDLYGIDTISVGNIIGFVMELYQREMISTDELDGIEAKWGSSEALIRLTEKICKAEGIGSLLQMGVREISKQFSGSDSFAMQIKGLEMPGYLPRAAKGIGLSYAISERGACHLKGSPLIELLGGADPLTNEGKPQLFKTTQSDVSVINAAILCYFVKFGITLKEIFQLVNPCSGFEYNNPRDLEKVGERISTLSRLFNTRDGFSSENDTLPKRCLSEPLPSGPAKGHMVELDSMKSEYYQLMGWDEKGVPTEEKIKELGLYDIII